MKKLKALIKQLKENRSILRDIMYENENHNKKSEGIWEWEAKAIKTITELNEMANKEIELNKN